MSSTERFDAASISITSSEVPAAIVRHDSHSPQGVTRRPVDAVQRAGEDLGERGLARPARADEEVGVVHPVALDRVSTACARRAPGRRPRRRPGGDGGGRARSRRSPRLSLVAARAASADFRQRPSQEHDRWRQGRLRGRYLQRAGPVCTCAQGVRGAADKEFGDSTGSAPMSRMRTRCIESTALVALAIAALAPALAAMPATAEMRSKKINGHLCKTTGGGALREDPRLPRREDRPPPADRTSRWMKRNASTSSSPTATRPTGPRAPTASTRSASPPTSSPTAAGGWKRDRPPRRARRAAPEPARARPCAGSATTATRATAAAITCTSRGATHHTTPRDPARMVVYTRMCPGRSGGKPPKGGGGGKPIAVRRRRAQPARLGKTAPGRDGRHRADRPRDARARRLASQARVRAGPCGPPSRAVPGRSRRGWLGSGVSAALARYRLRLLPSGPDLIHGRALRGT